MGGICVLESVRGFMPPGELVSAEPLLAALQEKPLGRDVRGKRVAVEHKVPPTSTTDVARGLEVWMTLPACWR